MSPKALLVEDEELVGTMVRMNLESAGYEVVWQRRGSQAVELASQGTFDVILLDISLPERDGMTILEELRQNNVNTPVMMLTARGDTATKVQALEIGADDYLPKPFDVAEMIARVNALVRRSQSDRELPSDHVVKLGNFQINVETREATCNEGDIILGEKEVDIIKLLVKARGKTLTRSDILEDVWGMDVSPTERTVDNFIMRLRKLFEPDPDRPRHILTVRGSGYRLVL
ncbi:MAG: response regulator transcription factor [Deltaproteobacteria bacterium]|nr:response regulator transcription factor [Deltaproteobacteria bacterium]MBW1872014.1 response regulator transcription factor [Deltaproteobacteria bacterium]